MASLAPLEEFCHNMSRYEGGAEEGSATIGNNVGVHHGRPNLPCMNPSMTESALWLWRSFLHEDIGPASLEQLMDHLGLVFLD